MTEQMTDDQIAFVEKVCSGTSKTNNKDFEKNGYLVVKNLYDPEKLCRPVPEIRGQLSYWGKNEDEFKHTPVEDQVEGSVACYWHPQYRSIHSHIRLKLEKILGKKLYNTYYYDRFYFPGQELKIHCDRPSCEISVSIHISSNVENPWKLWIKTPDVGDVKGENHSVILDVGDGMIYKGCERPHWREPLQREYTRKWYGRKVEKKNLYYHQIFFHYVLADGIRSHHANDASH